MLTHDTLNPLQAVFSAQYLPHGHKEANEVMKQLEKALYAGLE